jgi:very-short-patch-repair endonuclease
MLSQHFDSPFEEEVYYELIKKIDVEKYELVSQVKQSGYSIDLAVRDKKTKNYILAIECDRYLYHPSQSQKENDYYRQAFLESKG